MHPQYPLTSIVNQSRLSFLSHVLNLNWSIRALSTDTDRHTHTHTHTHTHCRL